LWACKMCTYFHSPATYFLIFIFPDTTWRLEDYLQYFSYKCWSTQKMMLTCLLYLVAASHIPFRFKENMGCSQKAQNKESITKVTYSGSERLSKIMKRSHLPQYPSFVAKCSASIFKWRSVQLEMTLTLAYLHSTVFVFSYALLFIMQYNKYAA